MESLNIDIIDRDSGKIEQELVFGKSFLEWMYNSNTGRLTAPLLTKKIFSKLYGAYQSSKFSKNKIAKFIMNYQIDTSLFEEVEYLNFNEFFIRKFKVGSREFSASEDALCAFTEGRYLGFENCSQSTHLYIKNQMISPLKILGSKYGELFSQGPLLISRLAPIDYHCFHFPVDCKLVESWRVNGILDSVSPFATKKKNSIFFKNERHITILETKKNQKLAIVEVGAFCAGKIVQTHNATKSNFVKGEQKGHFLFGGSTVLLFGELGAFEIDEDIILNTKNNYETFIKLGSSIGTIGR